MEITAANRRFNVINTSQFPASEHAGAPAGGMHEGGDSQKTQPRHSWSAVEGALLGIWLGVLKPERGHISVGDNFFAMGGNSLHAAQVVAHVMDVFQVDIPLQVFFAAPTIAGLAQMIELQASRTA